MYSSTVFTEKVTGVLFYFHDAVFRYFWYLLYVRTP